MLNTLLNHMILLVNKTWGELILRKFRLYHACRSNEYNGKPVSSLQQFNHYASLDHNYPEILEQNNYSAEVN
jgi:hypothetical protein